MQKRGIVIALFLAAVLVLSGCESIKGINPFATAIEGDFDKSGCVDFGDFLKFAQAYGSGQGDELYEGSKEVIPGGQGAPTRRDVYSRYDINRNDNVDFADFLVFSKNYGKGCDSEQPAIDASQLGQEQAASKPAVNCEDFENEEQRTECLILKAGILGDKSYCDKINVAGDEDSTSALKCICTQKADYARGLEPDTSCVAGLIKGVAHGIGAGDSEMILKIAELGFIPQSSIRGDFNYDGCVDEKDKAFADKELQAWINLIKNSNKPDSSRTLDVATEYCKLNGYVKAKNYTINRISPYELGGTIYLPGLDRCGPCKIFIYTINCIDASGNIIFSGFNPNVQGESIDISYYKKDTNASPLIFFGEDEDFLNKKWVSYYDEGYYKDLFSKIFHKYDMDYKNDITWDEADKVVFETLKGQGCS